VGEWWIVWKTGAYGSITIQLIKEIGWQGVEWYLSQGMDQLWVLVNMVMNLQVPYTVGKYLDQQNYDLL
jgi:hypothetical protein